MALYAISDLHLPLGVEKPMDIFGPNWEGYVDRLYKNWNDTVKAGDAVIITGDISWATYLNEAERDFEFLRSLNGIKLISKGNHDYWWTTLAKLNAFAEEKGLIDMVFLHNNYYMHGKTAICAARGWNAAEDGGEDEKIFRREQIRLRLSIEAALGENPERIIVALHYPPVGAFGEILSEYGVTKCVFGHLHGVEEGKCEYESERDILVAADYLGFKPKLILE